MIVQFFQDNFTTLYNGDCRRMAELPDESIQMVVTSPPYWGLRKYAGNQDLIWGGDNHCEHQWGAIRKTIKHHSGETNPGLEAHFKDAGANDDTGNCFCSLCGAWRGAYGLEPAPELYVQHTIEILREIRRVLRKDGVVFLNLGDSYSATRWSNTPSTSFNPACADVLLKKKTNLPPKNLCLIPFRVAISAQEDGWWIRSVIIWNKTNPMPESVKDRPTESHEYILMLTKSAKYYWDQEAVREHCITGNGASMGIAKGRRFGGDGDNAVSGFGERELFNNPAGRNLRSVWTFPTKGYPEAHFAVFPEALPERCIKAGSKEGDTILDPFAGSGTTLWVAKKLGRKSIGYELSTEYCNLIVDRVRQGTMV